MNSYIQRNREEAKYISTAFLRADCYTLLRSYMILLLRLSMTGSPGFPLPLSLEQESGSEDQIWHQVLSAY